MSGVPSSKNIRTVQPYNLMVIARMIVGFDDDDVAAPLTRSPLP